jgi:putative sigma-54 modulation protein
MQTANVDLHITVTGRHMEISDAIREYAVKKVESLHLDYPRIIEAKVILDVPAHHRHFAEIVLFCANHITIECSSTCGDLYSALDETISKIARRMRKFKTRLLRNARPRSASIRFMDERVYEREVLDDGDLTENLPHLIHKETYKIRPLYADEAITDLEISDRNFVVFHNQETHGYSILYRRKDGEYGEIDLPIVNGVK